MKQILYEIIQKSKYKKPEKIKIHKIKKIEPKTAFQKVECPRTSSIIPYKLSRSMKEINFLSQTLDKILLSDLDSVDISEINANPYFNCNKYKTLLKPKTIINLKRPIRQNQHKYLFKGNILMAEKIKKKQK